MAEPTQHAPVTSTTLPTDIQVALASTPPVDAQPPVVTNPTTTQLEAKTDTPVEPVTLSNENQAEGPSFSQEVSPPSTITPSAPEPPKQPEPMETPVSNPANTAPVQTPDVAPEAAHSAEVPEPQNTLTHRFTEAEWTALREFRSQLPDIFAQAFPDNENARTTPITLWNIKIDPLHPNTDARVSVVLMKFLRARNLSARDARDMLVGTLRWRDHFKIDTLLQEEFPQEVFGNVGHVYGKDKGGRPIIYNVYGGNQDLKAVFGDVQRFIRWRVALMERTVATIDFNEVDQTLQIHDYAGVSITSRDANSKNAASEASNIFQNHYPEFLYKKFFINVPTLLNWIFWAFKPFIAANTLAKMSVVGTGSYAISKALLPEIDASQLPTRYGGQAEGF